MERAGMVFVCWGVEEGREGEEEDLWGEGAERYRCGWFFGMGLGVGESGEGRGWRGSYRVG